MTNLKKTACPICGNDVTELNRPFCSKRCAMVDLHNWITERYRIETHDHPESEELDHLDA